MRNIPDVALTAAPQMYLIYNNGQVATVGGTSAAAPLWAGFVALANQQAVAQGKPVAGFLNPTLYTLGNTPDYAAGMHDIVTGTNGYSAIPGFDLATGWGTPNGQAMINGLSSTTPAPSFTLSSSVSSTSVHAGSYTTAMIQITMQTGFTGSVSLSVSGLPAGVTATFSAVGPTGVSTLTLTAASDAAPATASISIQGVSGSLISQVSLSLRVSGIPGYTLKTSTDSVSIVQAGTASDTITVVPTNGFNGMVSLMVEGLPSGVTASFGRMVGGVSTMNLIASATAAPGSYDLTVTSLSGMLTGTVGITLTVLPSLGARVESREKDLPLLGERLNKIGAERGTCSLAGH
jgi:hypothetical protein